MVSEIILTLVIVTLLIFLYFEKKQNKDERERFTNALIAKNAPELRDLDLSKKVKPIDPKQANQPPDQVPVGDLTDEEFMNFIKEENG